MANKRIIYATKAIALKQTGAPIGDDILLMESSGLNNDNEWEVPRGVQTVGVTTTFNLEQVFQQGQLNLYENIEDRPDIEVTVNRVLDGSHPLYLMGSQDAGVTIAPVVGAFFPTRTLNERNASYQCDIAVLVYPDTNVVASGVRVSKMVASGMFLSAVTYTFPVDGNSTEEVTFVGNNKAWSAIASPGEDAVPAVSGVTGFTPPAAFWPGSGVIPHADQFPVKADEYATQWTDDAGVTRREDFDLNNTLLPKEIPGVSASTGKAESSDSKVIQNVTVSADLGRDEIFALGQKDTFHRVISFPLEVTCSIETISAAGDGITAMAERDNLSNQAIKLVTLQGLTVDLGAKNKLTSIDFTGGDTGGGEVSITYNYSNFNDLVVSHKYYQ